MTIQRMDGVNEEPEDAGGMHWLKNDSSTPWESEYVSQVLMVLVMPGDDLPVHPWRE